MQTFVILKPETIELELVGRIISRFEDAGLKIKRMKMCTKRVPWYRDHYRHLPESVLRSVQFSMQGPLIGIVLEGHDAIARIRKMVGCTLPEQAEVGSIRFDFGRYPAPRNLIHASDGPEAVQREIQLFFDEETDV